MTDPTHLASDPMIARLRRAAIAGAEWLHDVADRIEQLQMPHTEVIKLAEVSDDGADSAALMKALCKKVEAQRKRLAGLEQRVGAQGKTIAGHIDLMARLKDHMERMGFCTREEEPYLEELDEAIQKAHEL